MTSRDLLEEAQKCPGSILPAWVYLRMRHIFQSHGRYTPVLVEEQRKVVRQ